MLLNQEQEGTEKPSEFRCHYLPAGAQTKGSHSEPGVRQQQPRKGSELQAGHQQTRNKGFASEKHLSDVELQRNVRNPITEALSRPFSKARGVKRKAPGTDLCSADPLHHKHGPPLTQP